MRKILEELYYGNINPNEMKFERSSAFEGALKQALANAERVRKALSGRCEPLNGLLDAQDQMMSLTAKEYFVFGFQMGAKLMMEVLDEAGGDFRQTV